MGACRYGISLRVLNSIELSSLLQEEVDLIDDSKRF